MRVNKRDERNDIHRMDTNYYSARDRGMTVAQYVAATIECAHKRTMAVGSNAGQPIATMTAVIY